ncbi:2OG-Fe(II) oxygenase [Nostoc sp. NIES-3756]|nr:2OG-Fe(II) oxygenase [Nostoc sp. NIES-3756]
MKIPLINLAKFKHGDVQTQQNIVKQIYQACHEIGFMYLQTELSPEILEQVFCLSKKFFDLPVEVKQQLAWSDEFSNVGYVAMARESLNPKQPGDLKEAFNINLYVDSENINLSPHSPSGYACGTPPKKQATLSVSKNGKLSLGALSPLPTPISPNKEPLIIAFYQACTELANTVLEALALALELQVNFFTIRHNQHHHTLRLLHYPPLQTSPRPGQVRAGEHSDYGSITLLFQDEVGGLEVQTKNGEWISAPTIPDTVIVNTGDLMQRWTNDVFCSTKHRVIVPNNHRVQRSRYSIAFFCHPNHDTEIACLESCQQGKAPIYPPVLAGEYLVSRLQATY